ncbi:type IV pilus modification protein PilV [Dongshaea marina]|uniref:type IV pilus modification protein PilV n=1 Tax=Dongshaea marina TaxID=2047966 RepID=UPI000D3E410D|nr:type IV pilus modification protein PilV [Dongshaea marina]
MRRFSKQQGISLIEVMITAVVISIALLGLAAMQGISKFSSFEAQQRTLALYTANDLVERVLINRSSWEAAQPTSSAVGTGQTAIARPNCGQTTGLSTCATDALRVQFDLFSWQESILGSSVSGASGLLSPVGCVDLQNQTLTVVVSWLGRQQTSDAAATAFAQGCGTASSQRRQITMTTLL